MQHRPASMENNYTNRNLFVKVAQLFEGQADWEKNRKHNGSTKQLNHYHIKPLFK